MSGQGAMDCSAGGAVRSGPNPRTCEGYVTARLDGQLFGLGLPQVRDVFVPRGLCPVPLAPAWIAGVLNLRGRIVTAIDLRRRLGFPARSDDGRGIAIGVERDEDLYGLIADEIGDVLRPPPESFEPNPVNLDALWAPMCAGVHRLETGTMIVLDLEGVLDIARQDSAAQAAADIAR